MFNAIILIAATIYQGSELTQECKAMVEFRHAANVLRALYEESRRRARIEQPFITREQIAEAL